MCYNIVKIQSFFAPKLVRGVRNKNQIKIIEAMLRHPPPAENAISTPGVSMALAAVAFRWLLHENMNTYAYGRRRGLVAFSDQALPVPPAPKGPSLLYSIVHSPITEAIGLAFVIFFASAVISLTA